MKLKTQPLLLAIALTAFPALAKASDNWYGSLSVGYADPDSEVTPFGNNIAVDPDFPLDWDTDSTATFAIGVGYEFTERFRLELRYSTREVETDDTNIGTGARAGFDYNVQFEADVPVLSLESFYDFRAGETVRPYVKAGVGLASTESEATIGSNTDPLFTQILGPAGFLNSEGRYPYAEQSSDNFAWLVGVGLRWEVSTRIDLTLDLQHLNVGDVATASDPFTDSFGSDDLGLNEASVGINIRF